VGKVDLHIHTSASDGKFTPAEIVRKAWEQGLVYISICDHDSIEGVIPAREASWNLPGITVLGGVEINTDTSEGELHILGYLFDHDNTELKTTLIMLRNSRLDRAKKMIEKLGEMGININFRRVREIAGQGSVGRPHIAQAMLEKGYICTLREAFNKYISRGGPAYVARDKITPAEAVRLIVRAKGIPVLAHPFIAENPESFFPDLISAGLAGIEVYYGSYSPEQVHILLNLASKYHLLSTGGSDFHGLDAVNEFPLGTVDVPLTAAERLIALAQQGERVSY
jgi:predicted metal-dependent phosphoesterase TrpH